MVPAVRQFFDHGGTRLWVVRVSSNARGPVLRLPAGQSALLLRAAEPGAMERIRAAVDYDGLDDAEDRFNLTLQRLDPVTGTVVDQELFAALSPDAAEPEFVGDALRRSSIARVDGPLPERRPDATLRGDNRYDLAWVDCPFEAGSDGGTLSDYDLVGSRDGRNGIFALEDVEHFDLLYLPPRGAERDPGPAAILAAELYCRRRNAMLILDPPYACESVQSVVASIDDAGYASPNMISYFPRAVLRGATGGGAPEAIGGAIAGLISRLDSRHGRWAGLETGACRLAAGLLPAMQLDDGDKLMLARAGFNIVGREAAGRHAVTGSRTLSRGGESHGIFRSLPVRRLYLQVVTAIDLATRWTVFSEVDGEVADRLCSRIREYLARLYEMGALQDEACVVRCEPGVPGNPQGQGSRGVTLHLAFRPRECPVSVSLTVHQAASGFRVASPAFAPAGG